MRVFGNKRVEPTDEDRIAVARLSAVAARFKGEPASDFTEVSPDPFEASHASGGLEGSGEGEGPPEQESPDDEE